MLSESESELQLNMSEYIGYICCFACILFPFIFVPFFMSLKYNTEQLIYIWLLAYGIFNVFRLLSIAINSYRILVLQKSSTNTVKIIFVGMNILISLAFIITVIAILTIYDISNYPPHVAIIVFMALEILLLVCGGIWHFLFERS